MNSVLYAGLFVFASAVLGDNKGRIASVFSNVLDMQKITFDTAVSPELYILSNISRGQLNAADVN